MSGFFACREPTQITLSVTTDALCPEAALTAPRLVDALFATGKTIDPKDFTPSALTDQCQTGDPNVIGTLVLLPSGDDLAVEVLVVAGVELAGASGAVSPLSLSAEACQALVQNGGVGGIEGKPCILVRRRLGFVEHTKLVLPIDLDTRCIGKKCGEDESCFKGNCVPIDVECDVSGCNDPPGCTEDCDAGCASGTGRCQEGVCGCLPCDAGVCGDTCALSQSVGVCSEDDVCVCKTCEQPACTAECQGTCDPQDAGCDCSTCDPQICNGPGCSCQGADDSCICIGDCEPIRCEQTDCGADGFLGSCGTFEGEPACICACEDSECESDCEFGGSCQDGACTCNPACVDAQCESLLCDPGEVGQCYDGGCVCICEGTACTQSCESQSFDIGTCSMPGDPAGNCDCSNTGSGGAPPVGGAGGGTGVGGTGGNGGIGNGSGGFGGSGGDGGFGQGGTGTTTSGCSCGGVTCGPGQFCDLADNCTCECQPNACQSFCQFSVGENGTCIGSNPGNCMCDPSTSTSGGPVGGFGASTCASGAYTLAGCTQIACTMFCIANDCTIGTCLGPTTCECE